MNQLDAILNYISKPIISYTVSPHLEELLENYHRTSIFRSLAVLPPTLVHFPISFLNAFGKHETTYVEHISFRYLPLKTQLPPSHYHQIQPQINQIFEKIFEHSSSVAGLCAYIRGLEGDYSDEIFAEVHFISSDEQIPDVPESTTVVILPGPRPPPPSKSPKSSMIRISSGLPFAPKSLDEFLEVFQDSQEKSLNPQFSSLLFKFQQEIAPIVLQSLSNKIDIATKQAQKRLFSSPKDHQLLISGNLLYLLGLKIQSSDYFRLIQSGKQLVFALEKLNRLKQCQYSQQLLILAQQTGNLLFRRISISMFISARENDIYNQSVSYQLIYSEYVNSIQNAHCYLILFDYCKRFNKTNYSFLYNSVKIYFLQKKYQQSYNLCNELLKKTIRISNSTPLKQAILSIQIGNSIGIDQQKCKELCRQLAGIGFSTRKVEQNFQNKPLVTKQIYSEMLKIDKISLLKNGLSANLMEFDGQNLNFGRSSVVSRGMDAEWKMEKGVEIQVAESIFQRLELEGQDLVLNQAIFGEKCEIEQKFAVGDEITVILNIEYLVAFFDSNVKSVTISSENAEISAETGSLTFKLGKNQLIFSFQLIENMNFNKLNLLLNDTVISLPIDIPIIISPNALTPVNLILPPSFLTNRNEKCSIQMNKNHFLISSNLNQHVCFPAERITRQQENEFSHFFQILNVENSQILELLEDPEFTKNNLCKQILQRFLYDLTVQKHFKEDLKFCKSISKTVDFTINFSKPGTYNLVFYVFDGEQFVRIQRKIIVQEGVKNRIRFGNLKIVNQKMTFFAVRFNQKESFLYCNGGNLDRLGKVKGEFTVGRSEKGVELKQQYNQIEQNYNYYKRILTGKSLDLIICAVNDKLESMKNFQYVDTKEREKVGDGAREGDFERLEKVRNRYIDGVLRNQPLMFVTIEEDDIWFNYGKMSLDVVSGCFYQIGCVSGGIVVELYNLTNQKQMILINLQSVLGFVQGVQQYEVEIAERAYCQQEIKYFQSIKVFINKKLVYE